MEKFKLTITQGSKEIDVDDEGVDTMQIINVLNWLLIHYCKEMVGESDESIKKLMDSLNK